MIMAVLFFPAVIFSRSEAFAFFRAPKFSPSESGADFFAEKYWAQNKKPTRLRVGRNFLLYSSDYKFAPRALFRWHPKSKPARVGVASHGASSSQSPSQNRPKQV